MKKFILSALLGLCLLPAAKAVDGVHFHEAEAYCGNGTVVKRADASGGEVVSGTNYYTFVKKIKLPEPRGETYSVWVRARSDLPAHWYFWDEETKRARWFKTEAGAEANALPKWEWVNAGKFKSENGFVFPIYLKAPTDQKAASATGEIDCVVIAYGDVTPALLDEELRRKGEQAAQKVPAELAEKAALLSPYRRTINCPTVTTPPKVDGDLGDEAWKKASVLDTFVLIYGKEGAKQQTKAYLCRDKDNLYLAAELFESQTNGIIKTKTQKNNDVWTDDCVELFLDPGLTQKDAFHFVVNPLGTRQDNLSSKIDQVAFSSGVKKDWGAAAKILSDRWVVELAVPFSLLSDSAPGENETWGINICREERPFGELSYWSNTNDYFNKPSMFGFLIFNDSDTGMRGLNLSSEDKKLDVLFANAGGDHKSLRAKVTKDDAPVFEEERDLTPKEDGKDTVASFALQLPKAGCYLLEMTLSGKGRPLSLKVPFKTYSSGPVTVAWPPEERKNTLSILDGTIQHCFFLFGNHSQKNIKNPKLKVRVPAGVEVLDTKDSLNTFYYPSKLAEKKDVTKEGKKFVEHTFQIGRDIPKCRVEKARFFQGVCLFFRVADPSMAGRQENIFYSLEGDGMEEEANSFKLDILPKIKVQRTEKILVHNWLWTFNPNPDNWGQFTNTLARVGFNSVDMLDVKDKSHIKDLEEKGMSRINNVWWSWENKRLSTARPELRARTFKGETAEAVCPSVLLDDKGKLLLETFADRIAGAADGTANGYVWDLEGPACWEKCFCDRCVARFKQFAKLKTDETPTPIQIKTKFSREWVEFCCGQSAEMAGIIFAELKAKSPGVKFGIYSGTPSQMTCEAYRVDWKTMVPNVNMVFPSYYAGSASSLDENFTSGIKSLIKDVRTWQKTPVSIIATLTPGYERGQTVSPSAELIKIKVLRSVASGMEGVSFWWWGPFDGLYYKKLGEAVNTLSSFEKFFTEGKSVDGSLAAKHSHGKNMSFEVKKLGGAELTLVFNHSDKDPRRVTLEKRDSERMGDMTLLEYPSGKVLDFEKKLEVEIPPLETAVLLLCPKEDAKKFVQEWKTGDR